ncbi:hypothetical protein BKA81DRAFT_379797 [Phyllosticta paracitricarpa]|uniref:Uncharacterized protein n=2 Tax=Phyllosticta TaxID=121621 RepID=A0ABR1MPQ8_9PEZI
MDALIDKETRDVHHGRPGTRRIVEKSKTNETIQSEKGKEGKKEQNLGGQEYFVEQLMLSWQSEAIKTNGSVRAPSASIQVMKTSFSSRVRELRGSTWQLGAKLLALSFYLRSRQSFQGLAGPFSHAGLQLTVIWVGTWLVLFWRFLILLRFLVLFQHLCQSRLRTVPECCPACPDFRKLCFGIRHTLSMVSASSRALVCYLVIGFSSPDSDCLCEPSCWDMIA